MLALLVLAFAQGEVDVAAFLREHRGADRALSAGKSADARAGFERCLALSPKHATSAYGIACAYAKVGEHALALEWLARAAQWGYAEAELAVWDPDLAGLPASDAFSAALDALRKNATGSANRRLARTFDKAATSYPGEIAVARNGKRLVVGCSAGELLWFDAGDGAELARTASLGSPIWRVAVQPDNEGVVALTKDGTLHFWDPSLVGALRKFEAFPAPDETSGWRFGALLEFDPSGERLIAGSAKHGASLWSAKGELLQRLSTPPGFLSVDLAWNADGSRIARWEGTTVKFFDGRTGIALADHIETVSDVMSLDFDPKGNWIATGHMDGRVRLWDVQTLHMQHESIQITDIFKLDLNVRELCFSPNGEKLAFSTGFGVLVSVLDVAEWKTLWTSNHQGERLGIPFPMVWSSEGHRLWGSFADGVNQVLDVDVSTWSESNCLTRGPLPAVSTAGTTVMTNGFGISRLDPASGRVLWTRAAILRGGHFFHTLDGYFDASFDDLTGLQLLGPSDSKSETDLASRAIELFDPKRVRAAKAGISLAPLAW